MAFSEGELSPRQDEPAISTTRRHSEAIEDTHGTWPASRVPTWQKNGESRRRRATSLTQSLLQSSPPYGVWQASGQAASKAPTLADIKHGAFNESGWTAEGQLERRGFTSREIQERKSSRGSSQGSLKHANIFHAGQGSNRHNQSFSSANARIPEETGEPRFSFQPESSHETRRYSSPDYPPAAKVTAPARSNESNRLSTSTDAHRQDLQEHTGPDETGTYPNGYRFPPKHTWTQSFLIGLKAFWRFFITPFGFLITIYCLNIVAWGGMLFLILLKAAPAMCNPSCDDPNSARLIWIEIDSQILNALFCVTGFGLIPWRFRDLYYLMRWRAFGKFDGLRRLAGHNRSWFRLPGSDQLDPLQAPPPLYTKKKPKSIDSPPEWTVQELAELAKNPSIPLPPTSMPPAPLTGMRAPPTKPYLMDVVVWMYVLNTLLQGCLAGAMWGLNRFTRPPWVTGLLIGLACLVGIVAGLVAFNQGKKVKKVEGVPVEAEDSVDPLRDVEKAAQSRHVAKEAVE